MRQKFWGIVHNLIAHPLLIFETSWGDRFHDWTAEKAWPAGDENPQHIEEDGETP